MSHGQTRDYEKEFTLYTNSLSSSSILQVEILLFAANSP